MRSHQKRGVKMRVHRPWLLAIAGVLFGAAAAMAQAPDYQRIPDGFDFPADKARLDKERADQNMSAMRKHSWMLFAGMTQMTPDGTAYWETWYRANDAFAPAGQMLAPRGAQPRLRFERPNQFKHPGLPMAAPGASLMTLVMFNKETYDHIRSTRLFQESTLRTLNASFPASAPWNERKIPDFPARAAALKAIWWPAAADGKTPLPVWDSEPTPDNSTNLFINWSRVVAVDGTRESVPDGETASVKFVDKTFPSARVVGLDRFYKVKLDAKMVEDIRANTDSGIMVQLHQILDRDLQAGDYVLFMGFHLTTKEIDDWTWQTFWWHDRPNDGIYAADRPDAVKGVWRNYLMVNANDQITPKEADGSPHVGFNPWTEGALPGGTHSNCMTCHHRASYPSINFLPVTRGASDPATDAAFAPGRLQTDFMWSMIDRVK